MLKKIFSLSALIIVVTNCFSQQKAVSVDSINKLLASHTAVDTIRVKLFIDLARGYYFSNPDSGIIAGKQAYDMAIKIGDKKLTANALKMLGRNYNAKKIWADAERTYELAYQLYSELGNKKGMADMQSSLGNIAEGKSEYVTATIYYLRALKIAEESGEEAYMGIANGNLAVINQRLEKYNDAIAYYDKAAKMFEKVGDKASSATVLLNTGDIYRTKTAPDYEKAIIYFYKALKAFKEFGEKRQTVNTLSLIGASYIGKGEYVQSYPYLQEALLINDTLKDDYLKSAIYSFLAELYIKAPDSILAKLNINPVTKFITAKKYQQFGIDQFQVMKDKKRESELWNTMSVIYENLNDYPNALMAYRKFRTLQDTVFDSKKKEEIVRSQMQYEQEKKDALSLAEIKRQQTIRNFFIAGAAVVILTGILLFNFYKRRRDAKVKQNEAELKAEISDTEMKALRAQMNPHFIFNSLNSISDYIAKNNTQLADDYLTKFAKLMRLILENSEHKEVALADDLKALELYMQLESLRLNNKFSYEIKVDENIVTENTMIPPLLLQPFVENSIWHGIAGKEGSGTIIIRIKKEGETINCMVEDDGVGRKKTITNSEVNSGLKKSLGMKITSDRIAVLNKLKNANATVEVTNLSQGTRVEVKLPLELRA
jgi:tetratricopeptide (TPR) repeat protein